MDINKILVVVNIPFFNETLNVFIPVNKKVGTIKKVLIDMVMEYSNYSILNVENLKLYDKNACRLLDNNAYISNSNLHNGSVLILL